MAIVIAMPCEQAEGSSTERGELDARRFLRLFAFIIASLCLATSALADITDGHRAMKIKMTINGNTVTATLDDTTAAQSFYRLLPMTLELEDYTSTEKIAYPDSKLDVSEAPEGYKPSAGDITYYAPWGNLALFYKSFGYARGLVRLGELDDGADILRFTGKQKVVFERL